MLKKVDPVIEVAGLRVVRGGHVVIDGLDLRVPGGCVVGLLGPSGSGKTTLLRSIVGVQRVAGGEVRVLGEPAGCKSLRHRVAYATQAASVYDDLTVLENLRYFRAVLDVPAAAVDDAIAATGLAERSGRLAGTLSGGERSRLSLAVALLGAPEVIVLDEPTVGLDPILRRDLWDLFRRIAATGVALLVSSHVMDEALRCDRLLLMRQGRLLADGTLTEILDRTGTADVESAFIALIEAGEVVR